MSDIDLRFRMELLKNRQVRCHNAIYRKLFTIIWPCERYFDLFLSTDLVDAKIEAAKKIYYYLGTFEDVVLPRFVLSSAISVQYNNLKKNTNNYVPQDHILHSINMYVLGVYLFFNAPIFHEKLIERRTPESSIPQKIRHFIQQWKLFSLYHDVGYYLETNVDKFGKVATNNIEEVKEYCDTFYRELLKEFVSRSVARSIFAVSLVQRSNHKFSTSLIDIDNNTWEDVQGSPVTKRDINDRLAEFNGAIRIDLINSYFSFEHVNVLLDKSEVLAVVQDSLNEPIAILIIVEDRIDYFASIHNSDLIQSKYHKVSKYEDFSDLLPQDYKCIHYVKQLKEICYNHFEDADRDQAERFYRELPAQIKTQISFAVNETKLNQCYCSIYDWLQGCINDDFSNIQQNSVSKDSYIAEITKQLSRAINHDFTTVNVAKEEVEDVFEQIVTLLTDIDKRKTLADAIAHNITEDYNRSNGATHYMKSLALDSFVKASEDLGIHKEGAIENGPLKELTFLKYDPSQNSITFSLFESGNNPFAQKLHEEIEKRANILDIDFARLCNYRPGHTICDHSVISAGLLFQASIFSNVLAHYCDTQALIKHGWHGIGSYNKALNDENTSNISEVVFSILLHNIYTEASKPTFGIKYKHDVDADPFSYFSAFCDVFQKWNRQKLLDYSQAELPEMNFIGTEFDISVMDDVISLKCNSHDARFIREKLQEENEYIPGIADIVEIREY